MVCQKALLCLKGCHGVQSLVCHKALLCLQGCHGVHCCVRHKALPLPLPPPPFAGEFGEVELPPLVG